MRSLGELCVAAFYSVMCVCVYMCAYVHVCVRVNATYFKGSL